MRTSRSRAHWLRAGLVAACSALLTATAHTAAGGTLPRGGVLMLAVLMCAATAAPIASVRPQGRYAAPLVVTVAMGLAQLAGHLTLAAAGGPHHHGSGVTASMVATHLGAAVVLGVLITAVEHLYAVGTSVLCWLRLVEVPAPRSTPGPRRGRPNDVPAQSALRCAGLRMRAPPVGA